MIDNTAERSEEAAARLLNKACQCFEARRFVEVLQLCQKILDGRISVDIEPHLLADVFFLQGSVEVEDGNLYIALERFRQAIHLNPAKDLYHYNLGHAFSLLGEAQNAISCYEEALRINPRMAEAFNNIGVILSRINRKDEAASYFGRALAIDPQLEKARENVALAQRRGVVRVATTCNISPFSTIDPAGGEIHLQDGTTVGEYSQLKAVGGKIVIGARCSIQGFCQLYGHGGLTIGNDVRIASQTVIIPSNHNFDRIDVPISEQGETSRGITIGDDVWIGVGCKILDGVTIGTGCVIGAGSVVTRSIPPYSVAVGSPARVTRERGEAIIEQPREQRHHRLAGWPAEACGAE